MQIQFRMKKQPVKTKVFRRMMKEARQPGIPMNLGIKAFKRMLDDNPYFSESMKHKAVRAYKIRAYERLEAIREQYEKVYLSGAEKVVEDGLVLDKEEEV